MELSKYELTNDPVFFQLRDPVGNRLLYEQMEDDKGKMVDDPSKPVGVKIVSSDSEAFKLHIRRVQNRAQEARMARRNKLTAEELEDEAEKTLAACIFEFHHIEWKGEALKAPADNVRFLRVMPWAGEQIDAAIQERSRFMPALSKN